MDRTVPRIKLEPGSSGGEHLWVNIEQGLATTHLPSEPGPGSDGHGGGETLFSAANVKTEFPLPQLPVEFEIRSDEGSQYNKDFENVLIKKDVAIPLLPVKPSPGVSDANIEMPLADMKQECSDISGRADRRAEEGSTNESSDGAPYTDADISYPDIKQECAEYSRRADQPAVFPTPTKTAKTNAEICRHYRMRKKSKNAAKTQPGPIKKAMTTAERSRLYKLRKKNIKISEVIVYDEGSTNESSGGGSYTGVDISYPDIKQECVEYSGRADQPTVFAAKTSKTNAEISRHYRKRKKYKNAVEDETLFSAANVKMGITFLQLPVEFEIRSEGGSQCKGFEKVLVKEEQEVAIPLLPIKPEPGPPALSDDEGEGGGVFNANIEMPLADIKQERSGLSEKSDAVFPTPTKTAKTNAEICRHYRMRKKSKKAAQNPPGPIKKAMTAAERMRLYRLRKKNIKMALNTNESLNHESSSVLGDPDVLATTPELLF